MTVHALSTKTAWVRPDPAGGWTMHGEQHYADAVYKYHYERTYWSLCNLNHTYNAAYNGSDVMFFAVERFIRLWKKDEDSVCKSCCKKLCKKYEENWGHPFTWDPETYGLILLSDMKGV